MKRIALGLAVVIATGIAQASSIIDCVPNPSAANACVTANLPTFNMRLDWGMFGSPTGTDSQLWTGSAHGIGVTVQTDSPIGARTAEDYARIQLAPGLWVSQSFINGPYSFQGHFDSAPDAVYNEYGYRYANAGDHLIGMMGNNTGANWSLLITLSKPVDALAFRIAAISGTSSIFNANVTYYTGQFGAGNFFSASYTNLTGGGNCPGLSLAIPVPCNDAPLIGMAGLSAPFIQSIRISTNDPMGFFIGNLSIDAIPEPSPMMLCGFGVVLLVLGRKSLRRG